MHVDEGVCLLVQVHGTTMSSQQLLKEEVKIVGKSDEETEL